MGGWGGWPPALGVTAIHIAAVFGHVSVVKMLAESGAGVAPTARWSKPKHKPNKYYIMSAIFRICEILVVNISYHTQTPGQLSYRYASWMLRCVPRSFY